MNKKSIIYVPYYAVDTYQNCQQKWKYIFRDNMKTEAEPSLFEHMVFSDTLSECFLCKIRYGQDPDIDMVMKTMQKYLKDREDNLQVNWSRYNRVESYDRIEIALNIYMEKVFEQVEPVEINPPWAIKIGDYKVGGRVNLKLANGVYLNYSIGSKATAQSSLDKDEKVTAIAAGLGVPFRFVKHVSVLKSKPDVDHKFTTRTWEQVNLWIQKTKKVLKQMETGITYPNIGSWLCDEDKCPFWETCRFDLENEL